MCPPVAYDLKGLNFITLYAMQTSEAYNFFKYDDLCKIENPLCVFIFSFQSMLKEMRAVERQPFS